MSSKTQTDLIMKTKLQLRTAAALLILIGSMATVPAQPAPQSAPEVNPVTGLPVTPQWISPDWKDPDIVLTNVSYNGLPLSEVARNLREHFKDYFDILPLPTTFGKPWDQTMITLQLRNVKASEVFNAMNMVFENDRTPLRWELKMNYNRPTVQLRVLLDYLPELTRRIYWVGDLLGDKNAGGMTMERLNQTIHNIWDMEFGEGQIGQVQGDIEFHGDAQLLIVKGTPAQVDLVEQMLMALRQKVSFEHKSDELQNKTGGPNSAGPPRELPPPH